MFRIKPIKSEIIKKIECLGTRDYVEASINNGSGNKSCVILKKYMDLFADRIKNMEVFNDDVWVVTFPKCGTTWTQEMVWMLNNNLDYETALSTNINERFPFLELGGIQNFFDADTVEICENEARPRHIKSHMPMFMLPDKLWTVKPKIIYVVRNPKDVAVSYFHHYRHVFGYEGSLDEFTESFLKGHVLWAPFTEHVLEFWKIRNEPNILFLHYEDMKVDLPKIIEITMKYLGKNYNQDQIDKLCNHLSFESMRSNPMVNNDGLVQMVKEMQGESRSGEFQFIRKGKVGGFKEELSDEYNMKFEKLLKNAVFRELKFSYKGV